METKVKLGQKVYSIRLQDVVKVIAIDGDYAVVEDDEGNRYSTSLSKLETMDAHIENRLRLDQEE